MKTSSFLTILLAIITISEELIAQNITDDTPFKKKGHWDLRDTIVKGNDDKKGMNNASGNFSITALGGYYTNGINRKPSGGAYGAEVSYKINPRLHMIFGYLHSESSKLSKGNISVNQYSVTGNDFLGGLRFYLIDDALKLFGENSVNMYFFKANNEYSSPYYNTYNDVTAMNYLGINFGVGVDFKFLNILSCIVKANVGTFVVKGNYYSSVLGGLKYSF